MASERSFTVLWAMEVRSFHDGAEIMQALAVRGIGPAPRDAEDELPLRLQLGDRTGCVLATVHEGLAAAATVCRVGEVVWVQGRMVTDAEGARQLRVDHVRRAESHEYRRDHLSEGPHRPVEQMERDLRDLVATVQNPHLRALLDRLLGEDSECWHAFRCAPGAKRYHQAYPHGLLEHSLTVAQAVSTIAATFPGIDRDVAVTGALLHDVGKLDAYETVAEAISMSDLGKLFGEIPLGYYLVRRTIEDLEGFPESLCRDLLHIILSHHGSLEHGSPVVPCTREATLVHMIDNLGARLGSFDRLQRDLPAGEQWSAYDKAIGGGAYFAAAPEPEARRQRAA